MIYSFSIVCRVQSNIRIKLRGDLKGMQGVRSLKILPDVEYIEYYRTLGLTSDADQESVRRAFLLLCKKFHPDSGSPQADTHKFHEIEKAYRCLQARFINERWQLEHKQEKKTVEEFDIKHTAPQHREYLSYDGVGSGTPSQRQQQYLQHRASQAAERVLQHKLSGLEHKGDALSVQDQRRVNKTKTRFGMERLVEDLIQESMARGDFQNLPGAGKPLQNKSYNPHLDFVTHKMNEIMIENGFTPEWITLGREIEEDKLALRKRLRENAFLQDNSKKWNDIHAGLEASVKALNKKIQLFNLIVPILNRQMMLFRFDMELQKAMEAGPPHSKKSYENGSKSVETDSQFYILGFISSLFRGS